MHRFIGLILGVLVTLFAFKAKAEVYPDAEASQLYVFSIHEDRLSEALLQFAEQANLNLFFNPSGLEAYSSPVLEGQYTRDAALHHLLRDTPLEVQWTGVNTVSLREHALDLRPSQPEENAARVRPLERIVVHGYSGALRRSLAQKRANFSISEVISADDMGNLPNNNLTEALSRLPGLNAVRSHTTGEGDRVTLRGLSSEYNKYMVNGVTLGGVGSPEDDFYRGVRLSFMSPEGIDQINVRKSITPDMDGDTLGGTIDIRTPSALTQADTRFGLSVESRVQDKYDRPTSHTIAGSMRQIWDDQLGLFLTGFHEITRSKYEEIGDNGDHQPDRWYETSYRVDGWDYDRFKVPGFEMSRGVSQVERFGLNGSLNYESGAHQFHLHAQYNEYIETRHNNKRYMRNRPDVLSGRFVQVDPLRETFRDPEGWAHVRQDEELGAIYGEFQGHNWVGDYTLDDFVDQDEDGVLSDQDRTCQSNYSMCGASGLWDPQEFHIERLWAASRNRGVLASINLGGESDFERLSVHYELAFSHSEDVMDYDYEAAFETSVGQDADENGYWLGNKGFEITADNPRFPYYTLSEAGHRAIQDPARYNLDGLDVRRSGLEEQLYQAQLDLTYVPDLAWISTWQGGVKLVRSYRERFAADIGFDEARFEAAETYADFAPWFGEDITSLFGSHYQGVYRLGQSLDANQMIKAFGADFSQLDYDRVEAFSFQENTLAIYGLGAFDWGNTGLIAGLRIEHTGYQVKTTIDDPAQRAGFALGLIDENYTAHQASDHYTQILPSLHLTHRFTPHWVARAAAWTSYARPSVERMTRPLRFKFDRVPDGADERSDDPRDWTLTEIEGGNAHLEPTRAYNLDGAVEWYRAGGGAYSVGVFFKRIENFMIRGSSSVIRSGVEFDTNLEHLVAGYDISDYTRSDDLTVRQVSQGRRAEIYGLELSGREQLAFLPAPWDQLGLGVNATYQQSETVTGLYWHPENFRQPFFETPKFLFNGEVYWTGERWQGYVSYTHQSEFLEDYEYFNNNPYEQDYHFVDLSLTHFLGDAVEINLEVQNLFDSHIYWYTFGKDNDDLRTYIKSGRMISLGLHARF